MTKLQADIMNYIESCNNKGISVDTVDMLSHFHFVSPLKVGDAITALTNSKQILREPVGIRYTYTINKTR